MKIFSAIVAVCLSVYLLLEAHDMGGISLERIGYLIAAISLLVITIFLFVPVKKDNE
ncbi:MAG: hypothetical protein V7731_22720 [Amphritea sp.]